MAVGITETVPGVSGSTVAMILGIYERLIYSLSILTTDKRKEAVPFLFTFGVGMAIGFAFSIFLIDYLLTAYRTPTFTFFVGIIVGFLPYLWKETLIHAKGNLKIKHYFIILLFLCLVVFGQLFSSGFMIDMNDLSLADYVHFAIAGLIASTALLLPGISGALILTIFGLYEIAMESLISLHIPIILAIGSGVVLGGLFTSKLIRYLLTSYKVEIYTAMIGLVSGSIYVIVDHLDGMFDKTTVLLSLITFIMGVTFLVYLQQIQRHQLK